MKSRAGTGLFMSASLLLSGCADSDPEVTPGVEAEVYNHYYDDEDLISVKPVMYDPEGFYLDVWQCGHDEFEEANELGCLAIRVEVDRVTYETYPDGSTIVFAK